MTGRLSVFIGLAALASVLLGPPINLVGCLDQRGEFAGLCAGEAVVAEVDVRRLVRAAVVDAPICELELRDCVVFGSRRG